MKDTIEIEKPEEIETMEIPEEEYNFCFTADFDKFESLDKRLLPSVSDARRFLGKTVFGKYLPVKHFGSPVEIRKPKYLEHQLEQIDFLTQKLEAIEIEKVEVHFDPTKLPEDMPEELPYQRILLSEKTILNHSSRPIETSFEILGLILDRFKAGHEHYGFSVCLDF